MNKKRTKGQQDKKPFTAGEFIKYLQTFEPDKPLNMTIVTKRGREVFGYPVNKFTLITDVEEPHVMVEVAQAVRVERTAQRIKRKKQEQENGE